MRLAFVEHETAFLLLLVCSYCQSNTNIVCDVAEEGFTGTVLVNFGLNVRDCNVSEAILAKENKGIVFCKPFQRCRMMEQNEDIFHVQSIVTNEKHQVNVTIPQVSRSTIISPEGRWTLTYFSKSNVRVVESCFFFLYSKAINVQCSYTMLKCNEILMIRCTAYRVYPQVHCSINAHKTTFGYIILNTTFDHTSIHKYPVYYNTKCDICIQLINATTGVHRLNVDIYPNVTGTDDDLKLGQTKSLDVILESARLTLDNCLLSIEKGAEVTCHCQVKGCDFDPDSVVWYNMSDNRIVNTESDTLLFTANNFNTAFRCQATTRNYEKTILIEYRPQLVVYTITMLVNDQINKIVTLMENEHVTIQCVKDDDSESHMELMKGSARLVYSNNSNLVYTKTSLTCNDSGNYHCFDDNRRNERMTSLNILCPPRATTNYSHVYIAEKTIANISVSVTVQGNPAPRFYLIHRHRHSPCNITLSKSLQDANNLCRNTYNVQYIKGVTNIGRVILIISNLNEVAHSESINYSLTISNQIYQDLIIYFKIQFDQKTHVPYKYDWLN